ncbi:type VI secretion system baseplate subunit TssG [Acetobacteraceae bacterium]|nr:type VI secretion system baseplate subunit TssG [Acetobacteraceae bacterium]
MKTPAIIRKKERTRREKALGHLFHSPYVFTFDAAFMLISGWADKKDVFFQVVDNLVTPSAHILAVREDFRGRIRLTTSFSGLVGHNSVLPRYFTAELSKENHANSYALNDLLNLLTQQPLKQFALAGIKYQPHLQITKAIADHKKSNSVLFTRSLLALTGRDPDLSSFDKLDETRIFFSGLFAGKRRSAEKLRNFLEGWLESRVRIEQLKGQWSKLPEDQITRLPSKGFKGQYNQLDKGCVLGKRYWDVDGCIWIVIGPLNFKKFSILLPPSKRLQELFKLIQSYLGKTVDFKIRLVLDKQDVPALTLGKTKLGLTSWLPMKKQRRLDLEDLVFSLKENVY